MADKDNSWLGGIHIKNNLFLIIKCIVILHPWTHISPIIAVKDRINLEPITKHILGKIVSDKNSN